MPQRPPEKMPGEPQQQSQALLRIFIVMMIAVAVAWLISETQDPAVGDRIDYSVFRSQLQEGNVSRTTVQAEEIQGRFKEAVDVERSDGSSREVVDFITYLPSFGDEGLLSLLEQQDVSLTTRPPAETSWYWYLMIGLLPLVMLFGLGYMQARRMQGGGLGGGMMQMTKSRAKKHQRQDEETTFDDVAGAESAKQELQEIVAFLKDPIKLKRLGGEVPSGVLLVGPPGTGKTLLARAVAGEAEVLFFSISGSDFMEMFVGVGASRVRNMFAEAKKNAPSIIFIDELDSIGRRRGAGLGGGHDEREQTLNQLLSELDGFEPNQDVIVMAATNRPDILDKALLRPGRFDRRVTVNMPSIGDRVEILKIYAANKPMADDVELEKVARGTPGFSGADLKNLLQEAALMAARCNHDQIRHEDIEMARDKILMGLERKGLVLNEEEHRMIAYHEAGHAIVAAVLPKADPIHKVSTVPRSRSMGVTQQLPQKEKYVYAYEYLRDRLSVMMGGRAAENLIFESSSSGAGDDLIQASRLARRMVVQWGMSRHFNYMALGGEQDEVFLGQEIAGRREYSEETAREVDEEVRKILQEAYERAMQTLQEHRAELDELSRRLIEEEELSGETVLELLGKEG